MRVFLLLGLLVATAAVADTVPADNPDYTKALAQTVRLAEGLDSYVVNGVVKITTGPRGQAETPGGQLEFHGAARWPDRLLSSQSGDSFQMNLGTGPTRSWFYFSQIGKAYIGEPVKLTRDLDGARQLDLTVEKIFNFYGGLGNHLLPPGLPVMAKTGHETVFVNGHEIPCQVFSTVAEPQSVPPGKSTTGPLRFFFDPVSGLVLVQEVTVYFSQGGELEQRLRFELTDYTLNQGVADVVFDYTAAAGAQVVGNLDLLTNPEAMTGQQAPDITLTDLTGESYQLADLRGAPVFIDFWATWCGPCRAEMPHIQALYREFGLSAANSSGQMRFVGASSEGVATVSAFIAKNKYTFPIATVAGNDALSKFKTASIPTGFVIDAEGVIRAHLVGSQSEAQLRQAFARVGVK